MGVVIAHLRYKTTTVLSGTTNVSNYFVVIRLQLSIPLHSSARNASRYAPSHPRLPPNIHSVEIFVRTRLLDEAVHLALNGQRELAVARLRGAARDLPRALAASIGSCLNVAIVNSAQASLNLLHLEQRFRVDGIFLRSAR